MKTWRTWTRKELDRLESLRLDGRTAKQIADELGRSLPSVKCRLHQEQIVRPRTSGFRWLEILQVPRPIRETAKLMGTTHWAVKQAARKLRRAGFDIPFVRRRAFKE